MSRPVTLAPAPSGLIDRGDALLSLDEVRERIEAGTVDAIAIVVVHTDKTVSTAIVGSEIAEGLLMTGVALVQRRIVDAIVDRTTSD